MLINDDCINALKNIENNSIDLVVTDPPYLIDYKTNHRKDKEHRFCKPIENDGRGDEDIIKNSIKELWRVMKDDTAMYMFCGSTKCDFFKKELEKYFEIKNMIVWVKNNWTAGDLKGQFGKQYEIIFLVSKGKPKIRGKRFTDVWDFKRVSGKKQLHQNQKPIGLIYRCIKSHSDEGALILDPFAGSMTTAIASIVLKRKYICIEKDKEYFNIGKERVNDTIKNVPLF